MRYDAPCLKKDWKHAFLMHDDYEHVVLDGIEMTSKNIWEYEGSREELVKKLACYFYESGFKLSRELDDPAIEKEMLKFFSTSPLQALDVDGHIKNTSRLCLDVCRHFCLKSFYSTRANGTPSIYDVFNDKELLEKVLKNRLGWYTTTEPLKLDDGTVLEGEHPYLFDISHKMVVQGCHSTMTSANVSNFRPVVAKFLMSKFCPKNGKVLDLSMGWGARLLAAFSLGLSYYGIDPMTADELESMLAFISCNEKIQKALHEVNQSGVEAKLAKGISEDAKSYESFPDDIDYAIACPPYFKLEEYPCDESSTNAYSKYDEWLEGYWHKTISLMKSHLKPHAKFTLIMIERWDGNELLEDMSKVIEDEGFSIVDEMSYKTTRSHLTDKRTSRSLSKSTEKVRTFEKTA